MADILPTEKGPSAQTEDSNKDQWASRLKFPGAFWLWGIGIGWAVDLLFWEKRFGVSFGIWVALILVGSTYLARREGKRIPLASIVLMLAILATGTLAVFRMEPFTRLVNVMASLTLIVLLNITFLNGYWPHFRVKDFLLQAMYLFFVCGITGGVSLFSVSQKKSVSRDPGQAATFWKTTAVPVLRGILLAMPVVLVFTALLSSADPIFSDYASSFLDIFKIENLGEYAFRLFYILLLGYVFTGLLLHGILETGGMDRPDPKKPWMSPFLGWIETAIILYAVNLLFLGFVAIQFRYFFGGQANIHAAGYTYAEYARRGATELIFVAVLTLMLYLMLKTISRYQEHKRAFSAGTVMQVALVLVILVSSYQRLLLYEDAYGFTEIRTRTHIFIFWLGGLLITTVVLELLNRSERFFLALVVTCLGFTLTLGLINVEGFIVQKNVERTFQAHELDTDYLRRLTSDAVPQLIRSYNLPGLDTETKDHLGAELACRNYLLSEQTDLRWVSYNPSEVTAKRLLAEQNELLETYQVVAGSSASDPFVEIAGQRYSCYTERWFD